MTKKPKEYVKNKDLYEELVRYKALCKHNEENGLPLPQQTNLMGIAFMKIAENFANNYQFRNYPFKEEMILEALWFCVKSVDGFDTERFNNPFSFFTTSVYYAFIQKIQKEKKELYVRYRSIEMSGLFDYIEDHNEAEILESVHSLQSADTRQNFIRDYEESVKLKKDKIKARKAEKLEEESNSEE